MSISLNFPTDLPTLNLDFVNNPYLDPRITFTRNSTATYFNSAGVLTTVANNIPRFDYDPVTFKPKGLLIEEARTNSIRNNTMVGAAVGAPGTLPTNWSIYTTTTGYNREIIGTGTENGINYVDVRISGTGSGGANYLIIQEGLMTTGVSNNQTWTFSSYVKLAGGSLSNVTATYVQVDEKTAGGVYLDTGGSTSFTPNTSPLITQRRVTTFTTNAGDTVAGFTTFVGISFANGATIDVTLRIGMPQLELGAFATSVIPTSTVAVTRSVDLASMTGTNFSSWYNAVEGTIVTQAIGVNNVSGATRRFVEIGDTTALERFVVGYSATINTRFLVIDNNTTQADITVSTGVPAGSLVKMAAAYKVNDFQQASNNTLGTADASGTLPTVTTMLIGADTNGSTVAATLNGHIQRISYYPVRLANTQLQSITA